MFKQETLATLVVIFAIALILGQPVLAWMLGLLFVTVLLADRWSRWSLGRVRYERSLSQSHAFVGDKVVLTMRVVNPKLLSVPGLRCSDVVPARFDYGTPVLPSTKSNSVVLSRGLALRPYEAVSWQIELQCKVRGLHFFGPVELSASDPFGLNTTSTSIDAPTRLIVYPQLANLPNLTLRPRQPMGDRRTQRQLLTDPTRTIGIRDYQATDPFKTIHWGATARRGALQTRIFEPNTTLDLLIVLDLDTFEHYWEGIHPDLIEYLISVAATAASAAERGQWNFGLYANAGSVDSEQLARVPLGRSPAQLGAVLEALAKLVPYSVVGLPQLLRRIGSEFPWGATVLVISAVPSQDMQGTLLRLAERGRRVRWLYGGDGRLPVIPGVEVEALPFDAAWQATHITQITVDQAR
ncbi:MAG: DUF58 domain-containing protein [Herpetosiphonaceae bacterium]|nr:DUF58 domain-containing protein [Herpetosiphonaceae bacterium]